MLINSLNKAIFVLKTIIESKDVDENSEDYHDFLISLMKQASNNKRISEA